VRKYINISINPSFGLISDEKSDMLELIDILIENCKKEKDKERLKKLKKEVLAWKNN